MNPADIIEAWSLTVRLASVSAIVSSLELLNRHAMYSEQGLYAARLTMLQARWMQTRLVRPVLRLTWSPPAVIATLFVRLILGALLLWRPGDVPLLLAMTIFNSLIYLRFPIGRDGADQVLSIIMVSLSIGALAHSMVAREMALAFIGVQGVLSYVIAGVAKVIMRDWRNGIFLKGIMSTKTYGNDAVHGLLAKSPAAARAASIGLISFEIAMVATLFLPKPITLGLLACAIVFHIATALVMGLNDFVPAFVATYPSILFVRAMVGPS